MPDGAHPHRTSDVFSMFEEHFQHLVIDLVYRDHSGMGINCSPYSSDFKLCDKVHSTNTKKASELKIAM